MGILSKRIGKILLGVNTLKYRRCEFMNQVLAVWFLSCSKTFFSSLKWVFGLVWKEETNYRLVCMERYSSLLLAPDIHLKFNTLALNDRVVLFNGYHWEAIWGYANLSETNLVWNDYLHYPSPPTTSHKIKLYTLVIAAFAPN